MSKIDLRSDTVTRPTEGMLDAMFSAQVGDDVFGEDPTVNALEKKVANLFGKEAGLFCSSGTQTNQIGIRLHTTPGGEVITHKESHVYKYEGGGIAVNSGCSVKLLDGNFGRITLDQVKASVNNPLDVHLPLTQLVSVEDTANRGGGAIYDFEELKAISKFCRDNKFKFHLDGARVFNALVETNISTTEYGSLFDTISICFSKGLGTPIGSVLVGSKEDMIRARRIRKVLGGGMRQVGFLGAAANYALDHHIERLKIDHEHARMIADEIRGCDWIEEILPVPTNIVVIKLRDKTDMNLVIEKLKEKDILVVAFGPQMIRMVTHLDISRMMVAETIETVKKMKI